MQQLVKFERTNLITEFKRTMIIPVELCHIDRALLEIYKAIELGANGVFKQQAIDVEILLFIGALTSQSDEYSPGDATIYGYYTGGRNGRTPAAMRQYTTILET